MRKTIKVLVVSVKRVIGEVMENYQVMLCLTIQVADAAGRQSRTRLTETALPHSKY